MRNWMVISKVCLEMVDANNETDLGWLFQICQLHLRLSPAWCLETCHSTWNRLFFLLREGGLHSRVHAGLPDFPDSISLQGSVTEIQQLLTTDAQQCVLAMLEWGDNGRSILKPYLPQMPNQTLLPQCFTHFWSHDFFCLNFFKSGFPLCSL